MHANYFFINDAANRKTIERITERLPHLDVVAPLALVVEACGHAERVTVSSGGRVREKRISAITFHALRATIA